MSFKRTLIRHSTANYTTRVPQDEALIAMKDLTPKAYQLLIYYYSKQDGWNFDDDEIGAVLDTTERQVKVYRRELVSKEYLWYQKGGGLTIFFVGRRAVHDFKHTPDD